MASSDPRNLYLERLTEGQNYRKLHFRQQITILGAKDCEIVICSKFVSHRHCEIKFRNSKMYIRNVASTNGTFVNGTKIEQETELKEGDMVGIGCNPASLEKNRMNESFLIYKVIDGIETIELSSDEEGKTDPIETIETIELSPDEEQNDDTKIAVRSTLPMDRNHALPLSPPTSSARSLPTTRVPGPSKNGKVINPNSTSADAAPSTSKAARQSKKKVLSPMKFADDFKGGPNVGASSSCNGSSRVPKSSKEPSLQKHQRKAAKVPKKLEKVDSVKHSSMELTAKQRASRKSIQSPNVEKRARDSSTPGARDGKQEKQEKMKRRATVCVEDENEVSRTEKVKVPRKPTIIDAPNLRKCVSSVNPGTSATKKQQTINRILQWKTEWLQTAIPQPEAGRARDIEQELLATVVQKYQELYKNANDSWDILTIKEVKRLNFELCELTFFSSVSTLPRHYGIGSLLLIETHESSSFGYISGIEWKGAGEARYITVQTSLDYSKLDIFDDVKSRHVLEISSGVKSINARFVN